MFTTFSQYYNYLNHNMSFASFITKLFGNKSTRDLKEIEPIVKQIEALEPEVKALTIDQLRERITDIRADIMAAVAPQREENDRLKVEVEELPFDERQPVWDKIDRNEKIMLDTIEDKLNSHLPMVFAVIRETAARFAANETIVVKATELDRELAAQGKDFVSIDGDNAIWKNHWMAGGNEITWDMVHYRVQLIGGIVLHQGKIAEMATGEGLPPSPLCGSPLS